MTPEERDLVLSLVVVPGQGPALAPDTFLERLGARDGAAFATRVLGQAIAERSAVDVEMGLIVLDVFGPSARHLDILMQLVDAPWHFRHEDVVALLGRLGCPESVPALLHAARTFPSYLAYDDGQALATKALWALGNTPGESARAALLELSRSDRESLRVEAARQLARRSDNSI